MEAGSERPTGTVTFLFSDIEGSTRLLQRLGPLYPDALEEHQRLLRKAFAEHNGHEIDTQGDSFFVAFRRAKDAVAAAIDGQQAITAHEWPDGAQLRVRMGIHTGEPMVGTKSYIGLGVHRAARVGSTAVGGQVLLSETTRSLLRDDPLPNVVLRDLGLRQLKDIDEPERLFELNAPGLARVGRSARKPWTPRRRFAVGSALAIAAVVAGVGTFLSRDGSETANAAILATTIDSSWIQPDQKATIRGSLTKLASVTAVVVSKSGSVVRTLVPEWNAAHRDFALVWDGLTADGHALADGEYRVRIAVVGGHGHAAEREVQVGIESQPPAVTWQVPKTLESHQNAVFTIADKLSGVYEVAVKVDGRSTGFRTLPERFWPKRVTSFKVLATGGWRPGKHIIHVAVTNTVGLTRTVIRVIDAR